MKVSKKFKGLMDIDTASRRYKKAKSTLRNKITLGYFIKGVDCVKFGNTWVFDEEALKREFERD